MKMDIKTKLTIARQDIDELLANTEFISGTKIIRKKYKIPSKGFLDSKDFKDWRNLLLKDENKLNGYIKDIKHLQNKTKLTDRWFDFVRSYIETNDLINQTFPKFVIHSIKEDGHRNIESGLYLRIYPNTRMRDIKESWKFIEVWQKRLPGYIKRKKVKPKHRRDMKFLSDTTKKKVHEVAEKIYSGDDDKKADRTIHMLKKAMTKKKTSIKRPK